MIQQENVRWIYQIRMVPNRMVKGKIIKESKQTLYNSKKNWNNKGSLEREKDQGENLYIERNWKFLYENDCMKIHILSSLNN